MNADDVIQQLRDEVRCVVGATAQVGSAYYDRAIRLNFVECCGSRSRGYNCREYIACGSRGGRLYISLNLSAEPPLISCGPKGFHYLNGTNPCV